MRPTLLALLATGGLLVISCSSTDSGQEAPEVVEIDSACAPLFCVDYPAGWRVEVGDTFIRFEHPLDPERILGSVGLVNMRGLVVGAGEPWPASIEEAVSAFWTLLSDNQDASLDSLTVGDDGSVISVGTLEGLRLWHRLIQLDEQLAVGIEVRTPNAGWDGHVQVLRDGLTLVEE